MWDYAGVGCLYLIGQLLGLGSVTRLLWLGVPNYVCVPIGIVFGLGIGQYLSKKD